MIDSDEVVQVYIGYPNTAVQRPKKELKTFMRVHLKAGEKQTVPIAVPVDWSVSFNEVSAHS